MARKRELKINQDRHCMMIMEKCFPANDRLKLFFYRPSEHFTLSGLKEALSPYVRCRPSAFVPSLIPLINPERNLFEVVDNPGTADFILYPLSLCSMIYRCGLDGDYGDPSLVPSDPNGNRLLLDYLMSLPYFDRYHEKHVFFTQHDWTGPYEVRCVVLNSSLSRKNDNPNQIACPYWVEAASVKQPDHLLRYHSSFIGYLGSHTLRPRLMTALCAYLNETPGLNIYLDASPRFHEHWGDEAITAQRKEQFLRVLAQSITVLCPRGTGANSARFFETMSMGRIPILISDECVLPLEGKVEWDSMILRVPETQVANIGEILQRWFEGRTTRELIQMCLKNRMVWETYFHLSKSQIFYHRCLHQLLRANRH